MKEGNVDQYIAEFQQLAHRANLNVNDAGNTRMFAAGLPSKLADTYIDISHPRTFTKWAKAAQQHHKGYLQKQSLKGIFRGTPQSGTSRPNNNN